MFLSLLTIAGLSMGAAQAADFPKAKYDLQLDQYAINTQDYQFPSGLRILFQEDHTQPIVSITNWFDRGSVYDGVGVNGESTEGIAHAVEHLAFRAKHGDLPKNWDVINQLGGILNASTSREWTNYMTVAPVDAAVPLLRIEALRMEDGIAGVTEEDVEAEKSIVRNELRMGYESGANGSAAVRTAFVHIPKLLYPPGHIYQNSTIGSHETITNITLADVQRYVDENYRPEFATIAVVGDFTLEGGQGMGMIFEAFDGVEHLLMAPEDAEKYEALEDQQARIAYLNEWVPRLAEFIRTEGAKPPEPRVDCSNK
ncbi:MAG: insulinase family protein, partial [Myxococcota bacterium]|nr:insulinase family protein [Myxococcota bacterium]